QAQIPDEPMELIINNGVANSATSAWHTTLDSSTPYSMAMQVADVQVYQTPGSGETIMGSNVTGTGSTGTGKPTVAITSTGGTVTSIAQTVAGTVDLADAGSTVRVFDGTTQIGTAMAASNGGWTANVKLTNGGANAVTATDANAAGTGTSNSVTYTVAGPAAPTISIANPSLSVTEGGGTVGLGITESPNTPYTGTVVTIQGLPSYETITDKHDQMTFQGNLITLTGTEVNSGLTLHRASIRNIDGHREQLCKRRVLCHVGAADDCCDRPDRRNWDLQFRHLHRRSPARPHHFDCQSEPFGHGRRRNRRPRHQGVPEHPQY